MASCLLFYKSLVQDTQLNEVYKIIFTMTDLLLHDKIPLLLSVVGNISVTIFKGTFYNVKYKNSSTCIKTSGIKF